MAATGIYTTYNLFTLNLLALQVQYFIRLIEMEFDVFLKYFIYCVWVHAMLESS
jgi:hypothetical protein